MIVVLMSFTKLVNRAVKHNKANEEKKSIHMTYKKLNGRTVKRKISPIEMKGANLLAWDHKRQAVRSFKMERVKHMEKTAFWKGFIKTAWHNAAELAGLATLAAPSIQGLRGKPMKDKTSHKVELAGLGMLAAPTIANVAKKAFGK